MMQHIKHFNKSVDDVLNLKAFAELRRSIQNYKENHGCIDYYQTLDNLGFEINIEFTVLPVKIDHYLPCINYKVGNNFNEEPRLEEKIGIDSAFKSLNDCYFYIGKEYIYVLHELGYSYP